MDVIGIASGKGGVGKTATSINLAVGLVMRGHKVMLFDADMGLANAQLALGCTTPFNFGHVISGEKTLEEIIVTTRQGIRLVPGASGVHKLASLDTLEASAIVQAFSSIEEQIDFLIVDSAAGISSSVLTFMQAAQRRLIVLRDEPSSIADAYGTIKVLINECKLDEIYVVPNMVDSQSAGRLLYNRINDVCKKFLGQPVKYLHSITHDEHMLGAARNYQSVLEFAPGGNAARDFRKLAETVESLTPTAAQGGGLQFFFERIIAEKAV